jgi:epoxyqueuosine reductase QueG
MTAAELERLAEALGIDAIGAAPAEPYTDTERHIAERGERGLFADLKFTMAQPEVSCHPETLLRGRPGARAGRGTPPALHVDRRLRPASRAPR